jgi:DNA-binding NtrC family response regulator
VFLNIFGLGRQGGHVNKILIIEDEDRIREIVIEYLKNKGFYVCGAQD